MEEEAAVEEVAAVEEEAAVAREEDVGEMVEMVAEEELVEAAPITIRGANGAYFSNVACSCLTVCFFLFPVETNNINLNRYLKCYSL